MNTNFIKKRNLIVSVLFSFCTFGIYFLFWFYSLVNTIYILDECNDSILFDIIFSFITCGLYGIFLVYKTSKKLRSIEEKAGKIPTTSPALYTVLSLFGFLIVDLVLIQNTLNQIKDASTVN